MRFMEVLGANWFEYCFGDVFRKQIGEAKSITLFKYS